MYDQRRLRVAFLYAFDLIEMLDLGRPEQVQLIFSRRIIRRTPGRMRTRILTHAVIPSLHVYYKYTGSSSTRKVVRAYRDHHRASESPHHPEHECGRGLAVILLVSSRADFSDWRAGMCGLP